MPIKAKHFSMAKLLWNNVAYCDQWAKAMAVYDECGNLRAVIKNIIADEYDLLLIGEDEQVLYELSGINLGTTKKNMQSCFDIYQQLHYTATPTYTPSYYKDKRVSLLQIFPHTIAAAQRSGGFHVVTEKEIGSKINDALQYYEEAIDCGVDTERLSYDYDDEDGYDDDWDFFEDDEDDGGLF